MPANQTKTDGVNLTLATNSGALVKTGSSFAGWNTAANGSGTNYAGGAIYTANTAVTLYAKWVLNTAPVASNLSISTSQNTAVSGVLPATDAESNPLTFSIVANGAKGTAVHHQRGDGRVHLHAECWRDRHRHGHLPGHRRLRCLQLGDGDDHDQQLAEAGQRAVCDAESGGRWSDGAVQRCGERQRSTDLSVGLRRRLERIGRGRFACVRGGRATTRRR